MKILAMCRKQNCMDAFREMETFLYSSMEGEKFWFWNESPRPTPTLVPKLFCDHIYQGTFVKRNLLSFDLWELLLGLKKQA